MIGSARLLEARPGPATAHRHRGSSLRCPPHRRCGATIAHRHRGRTPGVLHTSWAFAADGARRVGSMPCRRVACFVGPGRCVCRWAAARPLAVRAASCARRVVSKPGQALPPPTGTAAVPSGVLHTGGAAPPSPTGTAAGPPVSSTPVGPSRLMVLGASARCPAAAWPVLLGRAAVCAGGRRPARSPSAPRAALGASSRSPVRPCRRPPAPRPGPAGLAAPPIGRACRLCVDRLRRRPPARRSGPPAPPAPSTPAGPGVLVCCSSFRNLACNSPPALCWFVSVCDGTPLVFVNCMRLLLSAGPAVAHRHRGWAVLTFPVLQADQTGCVRG